MTYEIDHIFILSDVNAPAANQLVEAGMIEGESRVHHGQGTTNRRFFFHNTMIEFLWVHDAEETASDRTRPTQLLPRWQERLQAASPFGICFRPIGSDKQSAPFPSWDYKPTYIPDGLSIQIADSVTRLEEPFLFYASWITAPSLAHAPTQHPAGMQNMTAVTLTYPYPALQSKAMDAVSHLVTFEPGEAHRLTVTFDDHTQGQTLDFQPELPLVLRY